MEFAEKINDNNFYRYVGYRETNPGLIKLFSRPTIDTISHKITQLLLGVLPNNRPIIVPDTTITNILSEVKNSYNPNVGDIYSRYNIPSGDGDNSIQIIIDQVINIIVTDVKNNLETEHNNSKLTAWTTVLGDHNTQGLRGHDIIKVNNKRPKSFQFNMNY